MKHKIDKLSEHDRNVAKEVMHLRDLGVCWYKLERRFDMNRVQLEHLISMYKADQDASSQN